MPNSRPIHFIFATDHSNFGYNNHDRAVGPWILVHSSFLDKSWSTSILIIKVWKWFFLILPVTVLFTSSAAAVSSLHGAKPLVSVSAQLSFCPCSFFLFLLLLLYLSWPFLDKLWYVAFHIFLVVFYMSSQATSRHLYFVGHEIPI